MADAMDWIENYLKNNFVTFGIIGGISMLFYLIKYKGLFNVPPTLHLITAIIALGAAGWGFVINQGASSNYTYYYDGYYYFA